MAGQPDLEFHSTSSDDDDIESHDSHSRHSNHNHNREATSGPLAKQSTVASGLSVFEQRAQSTISRIRSREPGQTAKFSHPLTHTKTSQDVIVDFDGPDDPYRPLNWGFTKKAVTTVLYGLTTMGEFALRCVGEYPTRVRGIEGFRDRVANCFFFAV